MKLLALILLCACLCQADLSSLMQTDTGGNLRSHMFLAAFHGYSVSAEGLVTIGENVYQIWPDVLMQENETIA